MNEIPNSNKSGAGDLPTSPDVVVIGGGLAGLTAAATIAQAGRTVVVHEKRGVLGGDARSVMNDGFTFNQGPHALYRGGPAERILKELGVKIRGGQPPTKGRLAFDGETWVAPAGPASLLQTRALTLKGKIEVGRALAGLPKLRPADYATTTVEQWIASTVGGDRPAEMLRSLVRLATYSNAPGELSADVAITQLQSALGEGVYYLDDGWQTLIDQLAAVPGVHIKTDDGLAELPDARVVIIAAGGPRTAASLLNKNFQLGPPSHVSCVDLGLSRAPTHDFIIGGDVPFYFSNHSSVADVAPEGRCHATAIQYLADGVEPDVKAIMDFSALAGVRDQDVLVSRRLHRMTAVTALATAASGGLPGRPAITDTGHQNVFIAGDWVGPVGHLADATIASAKAAADAAVAQLSNPVAA